jgi:hypothetical protein
VYGESVKSPEGSGAEIQLMPDAPVSLQNDATITSETKIDSHGHLELLMVGHLSSITMFGTIRLQIL